MGLVHESGPLLCYFALHETLRILYLPEALMQAHSHASLLRGDSPRELHLAPALTQSNAYLFEVKIHLSAFLNSRIQI